MELLRNFEHAFGCTILEGFGMSETSPVVPFNHLDRPRKPGPIGTSILDVEVRLLDDTATTWPPARSASSPCEARTS